VSDNEQIQLAFRQAVQRVWKQVVDTPMPSSLDGAINGAALLEGITRAQDSLETLGFRPEHIRVLKTLCVLLKHCTRIEATPTNLGMVEPLFCPVTPVTPASAEAFEEVVAAFASSIGAPKKRGWFRWF
jgi:hypothetical protein